MDCKFCANEILCRGSKETKKRCEEVCLWRPKEVNVSRPKDTATLRGSRLTTDTLAIINGDRQDQYGNPEDSFDLVAVRWSQYLKARYGFTKDLINADVAFMMADLKMARECKAHKRDNMVDLTGYIALKDDMERN